MRKKHCSYPCTDVILSFLRSAERLCLSLPAAVRISPILRTVTTGRGFVCCYAKDTLQITSPAKITVMLLSASDSLP